jgi:hypothetical protein
MRGAIDDAHPALTDHGIDAIPGEDGAYPRPAVHEAGKPTLSDAYVLIATISPLSPRDGGAVYLMGAVGPGSTGTPTGRASLPPTTLQTSIGRW